MSTARPKKSRSVCPRTTTIQVRREPLSGSGVQRGVARPRPTHTLRTAARSCAFIRFSDPPIQRAASRDANPISAYAPARAASTQPSKCPLTPAGCKPNSVFVHKTERIISLSGLTRNLPRSREDEAGHFVVPYLTLRPMGFSVPSMTFVRGGGLLPHLFTLTSRLWSPVAV